MHSSELDAVWDALVALLPGVSAQDENATREFAKRLGPLARAFFRQRGCSLSEAEDLAVTAMTEIVLKLGQFKGPNLKGWVYQLLGNLLADQFRRRIRTVPLDDGDLDRPVSEPAQDGVLDEAGHGALEEHLAALSDAERRVLLLRHGREALPYEELARELGVKPGTARVRYLRAREKLETCLRKDPRIQAALARRHRRQL